MTIYECLEDEACEDGIDVIDYRFESSRIKGLYCNGIIGINSGIKTSKERACVLAEELGHHYTSTGNIINMDDVQNRKQEYRARLWGYNKKIGLTGLINAYEYGCRSYEEISEYLDITEEYLDAAISCYRSKYNIYTTLDNYIIYFEPALVIGRIDG